MRFLVVVFVLMMASLAFAEGLEVEKIAEPATVESGGTVRILLNISNPFDEDIIVKIRDMNSLGGSTIDTQCIQGSIPANAFGISEYESVQVHNPGTFTLGTIELKYTNPSTGKEEVVSSRNRVDVTVVGGNPNIAFSSTSTKVECQFDEQQEQQQQQQESQEEKQREEMQKMMEEMMRQQDEMQRKLSESRQAMNQDMSSVKQQQETEAREANERVDEELSRELSSNEDFQNMKKELEDGGYQEKGRTRSPVRDNETEFKYGYEKPTGEKGGITGRMKDGEIEDLRKFSDDDAKELDEIVSLDDDFREAAKRLERDGFVPDTKAFSGLNAKNETEFNYRYKRADGESASIEGDIKDGEVMNVGSKSDVDEKRVMDALPENEDFRRLDDELRSEGFERGGFELDYFRKNESSFSLAYSKGNETMNITGRVELAGDDVIVSDIRLDDGRTMFDRLKIPLLLILVLLGVYSYLRHLRRGAAVEEVAGNAPVLKPVDARGEAMKLIRKAERMYRSGKKRDAYTTVSQGVRLYFKYVICSEKDELTTAEILRYVRAKEADEYGGWLKECFSLCDLVKFAKYRPNDRDFEKVLALSKKCVK